MVDRDHRGDDDSSTRRPAARGRLSSVIVAFSVLALMIATSGPLPMAWDEGNAILRAYDIVQWCGKVFVGEPGVFSDESIARHWRYTNAIEGHPAFYGTVIAVGMWAGGDWLEPLLACRLGPMALFAVASGAMYWRMSRDYGRTAAIASLAALVLMPRLLAHAHFASFDGPLMSCWILSWACFAPARVDWRAAIPWGVALGMTLSCKATGWVAPAPFVVWAIIYRDRPAARALLIAVPIAIMSFFVLNPPLWHDPWGGFAQFLELNTQRGFNVPTLFFGTVYDMNHRLPWYNTLVWLTISVPLGTLFLAASGVVSVLRRRGADREGILLIGHWLVLLVVRALPIAPPHDGIRLFLPSFAFCAALAGIGAHVWLSTPTADRPNNRRSKQIRWSIVTVAALSGITSTAWYAPQWLSYYSLPAGGLRGATRLGFEPTYYWDALDQSVLQWIGDHSTAADRVLFSTCSHENLVVMRTWDMLPVDYSPDATVPFRWYVLQHRPSVWTDIDRWLVEYETPALTKVIRPGGWGPWRLSVPLLEVYSADQYARAVQGVREGP